MRRIVVSTFASLDGVIDAPAESTYLRFNDREVEAYSWELLSTAGALLLGRKTFQGLAAAWRPRTGKFSDRLNTMPKFVVSTTLESADEWENSTLIAGEDIPGQVASLKAQSGGDIVSYGCGRLARTLTRLGLVDELQIWVAPLVVGSGTHLFGDPADTIDLRLTGTKAFPIGTVVLSYEPAAALAAS